MEPFNDMDDTATAGVYQLGLSPRSANALYNNGIRTLKDILEQDQMSLRGMPGLGQVAYEEILDLLNSLPQSIIDKYKLSTKPIPEDNVLELPVENIGYSARTTNALVNNGIRTVGDLYYTPQASVIDLPGMGEVGVNEIYSDDALNLLIDRLNHTDLSPEVVEAQEFHEFCVESLKERSLLIIDRYYGLSGAPGTLQEVGDQFQITRERARQIIKKTLQKIKTGIVTNKINPNIAATLQAAAATGTPIEAILEFDTVYSKKGIVAIYADIFSDQLKIFKDPALKSEWLVADMEKINANIVRSLELLKVQFGPVLITELASHAEISEELIYDLNKVTINDGLVVLNTNRRALGNDRVYEVGELLDRTVRPMSITEISNILRIPINLVRSAVGRVPGAVNVGLSTYALEKYGYTNKKTSDIVYDFLAEEGEPVHIDRILDHVKRYRFVKEGSVHAAISIEPDVFTRLDDGYLALTQWGYEPRELKTKRLEVPAIEAVVSVLELHDTPQSQQDILEDIKVRYGDRSTQSLVTVAATLKKLVENGTITKLGTSRSPYYLLPK